MNKQIKEQRAESRDGGFTIIELMISTAVFSVVLLLCAMAIVQVGQMFYKGVTINRTQDTARRTVDDIVQAIQFGVVSGSFYQTSAPVLINGVTVNTLCLGEVRYSYVTDRSLGSSSSQAKHVLWRDRISGSGTCTPQDLTLTTPSAGGQEMVGDNMRVPILSVTAPTSPNTIWNVSVTIAYGDNSDIFTDSTYTKCVGSNVGGQFCAVSAINTNVVKRL